MKGKAGKDEMVRNSKKIIIPIHSSIHQLQLAYGKRLEQAFTYLGHQVVLLNLEAEKNPLYLQAYIEQEKADLLVTIDCGGFELELLGDDLFYNSLCIPAMHFLVKPPWELADFLSQRMNFTMEFYTLYEGDKEFIEKYFKRVPKVHVIPEVVWENPVWMEEKTDAYAGEKKIGVAVVWDYISADEIMEQIKILPQVFFAIAVEAIHQRERNQALSPWKFLENYLSQIQFQVNSEEFMSLLLPVNLAFSYQEATEWEAAVHCLCSNQIPVHLYGSGWRKLTDKMEEAKVSQYLHIEADYSLNYEEMEMLCQQYEHILVNNRQERGMKYTPYIQGIWNTNDKEVLLPLVSNLEELAAKVKDTKIKMVLCEKEKMDKKWVTYLQEELDRIFL